MIQQINDPVVRQEVSDLLNLLKKTVETYNTPQDPKKYRLYKIVVETIRDLETGRYSQAVQGVEQVLWRHCLILKSLIAGGQGDSPTAQGQRVIIGKLIFQRWCLAQI